VDFLKKKNINTDTLQAVGCDATVVNTGRKGGIVRLAEERIGRPLQWLICLLHINELPLRHLMEKIDGATTGPKAFAGAIGKSLILCEQMDVVNYQHRSADIPEISTDLSTDQKYLLEIWTAVVTGTCSEDLARRHPGKLSHARWLTTANRILRLYVATESPTPQLQLLATYVSKVYAPMWFSIKTNSSCKDAARHLWKLIRLSRSLPDDVKTVIDPVIQRNAYAAHPENLMLSLLSDDRPHVRELALRRVLKARAVRSPGVRKFDIPALDFESDDYINLIQWEDIAVTDPPLLVTYSDEEISQYIHDNSKDIEFFKFPCHTPRAVERCVKMVTEASSKVCGAESRDGFITSSLESRDVMPLFNTKSHLTAE
jgi:hypothetical protein